jgi:hypothetical protein
MQLISTSDLVKFYVFAVCAFCSAREARDSHCDGGLVDHDFHTDHLRGRIMGCTLGLFFI